MSEKKHGRIVNIASAHGLVASPFKSAYVAAKHGIVGLTKTVALEVATQGITCNAICPGYVLTPLVQNQIADTAKARGMTEREVVEKVMLEAQPTKQFVTFDQLAGMMLYLVSDLGASANGAVLRSTAAGRPSSGAVRWTSSGCCGAPRRRRPRTRAGPEPETARYRPETDPGPARSAQFGLQGGGAHGAFEWGVLDRLLEDDRIRICAVTAASAGAMNAVALAAGLAEDGRAGPGPGDFAAS